MSGLIFASTVIQRELRLAARRPTEALLPVVFFVVAASLFPLGIGPEPDTLRHIAPGVLWVGALLGHPAVAWGNSGAVIGRTARWISCCWPANPPGCSPWPRPARIGSRMACPCCWRRRCWP